MENFKYAPLKDNEIRLLEIVPGTEDTPVAARLFHVKLDALPYYNALSYTWNNELAVEPIQVNSQQLLVTPNLHDALKQFRRQPVCETVTRQVRYESHIERNDDRVFASGSPSLMLRKSVKTAMRRLRVLLNQMSATKDLPRNFRGEQDYLLDGVRRDWNALAEAEGLPFLEDPMVLWIDAICINQQDPQERNQQVQIMCEIYEMAGHLLVWLGITDEGSERALKWIKTSKVFDSKRQRVEHEEERQWLLRQIPPYAQDSFVNDLFSFYGKPWFSRCWVVQEYTLGASRGFRLPGRYRTTFCCGSTQATDVLDAGVNLLKIGAELVTNTSTTEKKIQTTRILSNLEGFQKFASWLEHPVVDDGRYSPNGVPFVYIILKTLTFSASDPRDKLYAFLGLLKRINETILENSTIEGFLVDYRASLIDVYASLVKAHVLGVISLDILGLCKVQHETDLRIESKRTWVPQWEDQDSLNLNSAIVRHRGRSFSQVYTYSTAIYETYEVVFAADLSTLQVKGVLWDDITHIFDENSDIQEIRRVCWDTLAPKTWTRGFDKILKGARYIQDSTRAISRLLFIPYWHKCQYISSCFSSHYQWQAVMDAWLRHGINPARGEAIIEPESATAMNFEEAELFEKVRQNLSTGTLFITKHGYIGRCAFRLPKQESLVVAVVNSCAMPMMLREDKGGRYTLIGECYVEGLMQGQAYSAVHLESKRVQEFVLH